MWKYVNTKTKLEMPFDLIHIYQHLGDKLLYSDFKFSLKSIDDKQTKESVKYGGITAKFQCSLDSDNIKGKIVTKLTVGNVYEFYQQLKKAYDSLNGSALLTEYGSASNTHLEVTFERNGKCSIKGYIREKDYMIDMNAYRGIDINLICDQSYFSNAIKNFEILFEELARIQGDNKFI